MNSAKAKVDAAILEAVFPGSTIGRQPATHNSQAFMAWPMASPHPLPRRARFFGGAEHIERLDCLINRIAR
jgi:hypothetical protein